MSDYTLSEKLKMDTDEWMEKVVGLDLETVYFLDGPFEGEKKDGVSVNSDGLRLEVAGRGFATYERTAEVTDNDNPIFIFTGWEDL